ncbi:MAG: DNA primase [Alphaproteobacteria bacterium]|nr:DNA primase [Alphaproteobacteria bacterium]
MAFPPRFLEELRGRLSVVAVVGRRVRLTKRGREHTGLCPFHNEKTPSFTVSDDKGFYHCFGCGAHGDAIEFVRRAEGLNFTEAVERLAGEAGLALPEPDPAQRERIEHAAGLQQVVEACAAWFEAQLWGAGGRRGREYLAGRGLTEETIRNFRIGFAPEGRYALKQAMLARKIAEAVLVESGMLIRPEGGGESYDRFRDRIIFPIADRRGRVIAFGGRAFGDAKPKYLNSPDTPLFHKGRVLYNLSPAREAGRSAGTIVVAEGYMDVIAMAQAGIRHAVAPLGTALTEEQMEELWRLVPEPVLCLDGDQAGLRAAVRAAERALPILRPGQSLRFALLPGGEDPDSLVRARGRKALEEVLAGALPLAELIWRKETEQRPLGTPEQRAALEKALEEAARQIQDETLRGYYRRWFRDRLAQTFSPAPQAQRAPSRRPGGPAPPPVRGLSPAARARVKDDPRRKFEQMLVTVLLNHPRLVEQVAEEFAGLDLKQGELDRLRQAILDELSRHPGLDSGGLSTHLAALGLADIVTRLSGPKSLALPWFARPDAADEDALMAWRHILARHHSLVTLEADLRLAEARLADEMTEESLNRLRALQQAIALAGGDEAELDGFGRASGREAGI